jgi:O-antigen/teichoic acid export membrane protein
MSRSKARKARKSPGASKRKRRAQAKRSISFRGKLWGLLTSSLYRNAIFLMTNNMLMGMSGLAFWLLAARFYQTEDVGLGSAALSAMQLLGLFATLGLDYALIRFLPGSGKGARDMVNSCLTISGLAAIFFALVFIAGLDVWSPALLFLREDPVFLSAFVVLTAGWTLHMLGGKIFVAWRRTGYTLAEGTVFNALRIGLVILMASFFAVFGLFAAWGVAAALAIAVGILWFLPRVQRGYRPLPTIKRQVVAKVVRFSFANYVTALFWFAPSFVLPIMVVNRLGAEETAYFYIAWAISRLLFAAGMSISMSLFAEGSHDEKALLRDTRRSIMLTAAVVAPGALVIVFFGDDVLRLFDPEYAENGTDLMRVLVASALPLSLNHIFFGVRRVQMKMRSVVGLNALIATGTLAGSWVLLPDMGIMGAGVAWLSSQSVAALLVIALSLPGAGKLFAR